MSVTQAAKAQRYRALHEAPDAQRSVCRCTAGYSPEPGSARAGSA
jgi:hypothetical protein